MTHRFPRLLRCLLLVALAANAFSQAPAEVAAEGAIDRGVAWLLAAQELDGSWRGPQPDYYRGMTALAVYTLLKCGLAHDHPAIRAGLANLATWTPHQAYEGAGRELARTYDLGVALMCYAALPEDSRPLADVRAMAQRLVRTVGNRKQSNGARWGYPNDHPGNDDTWTDLSNTQYALLGLQAAHRSGVDAGSTALWIRIAEDLLDLQGYGGHFGYREGEDASASMTVAGITGLAVCREVLDQRASAGLSGRIRAGIGRGYLWLEKNWFVDRALDLRVKDQNNARWHFYYLYGLERIGAFVGRDKVGDHDWYAEGREVIVKKQAPNGSFGYGDDDTCFALLFLRRGSRASGLGPRRQALEVATEQLPFAIGADDQNPLRAWYRKPGAALSKALGEEARLVRLCWLVDGEQVDQKPLAGRETLLDDATQLHHRFLVNRTYAVRARLELMSKDGSPLVLESNILSIPVDNVELPWHREAIADTPLSLLAKGRATLEASSGNAALALDDHYGTSWVADAADLRPTLQLKLKKPVRANVLKLAGAAAYGGAADEYARPLEIEISINGGRSERVRISPDTRRKQWIRFPSTLVRRVTVRIVEVLRGRQGTRTGLKEVELFNLPDDAAQEGSKAPEQFDVVLETGKEGKVRWLYVTDAPTSDWATRDFRAQGWKSGAAGFGSDEGSPLAPRRTPWTTREIWVRTAFEAKIGDREDLRIQINHDDHAEVYLNGVLAATASGYSAGNYRILPLLPAARAALKEGKNVLAIHCTNTGGPGFLDVGIVRVIPR